MGWTSSITSPGPSEPIASQKALWCHLVSGFNPVAPFPHLKIERQRWIRASAFFRLCPIVFVGQIVFHRFQEEIAKLTSFSSGRPERVLFKEPGEKPLREIPGRLGIVALAPHIGVDRIPIDFAQGGKAFWDLSS